MKWIWLFSDHFDDDGDNDNDNDDDDDDDGDNDNDDNDDDDGLFFVYLCCSSEIGNDSDIFKDLSFASSVFALRWAISDSTNL